MQTLDIQNNMNKFCKNCGGRVSNSDLCQNCIPAGNSSNENIVPNISNDNINNLPKIKAREEAVQTILKGLGGMILGGIITWVSYSMTGPGGTYFVTTGIILVGGFSVLVGLISFIGSFIPSK